MSARSKFNQMNDSSHQPDDDFSRQLARRVAEGDDLISIWFERDNPQMLRQLSDSVGYQIKLPSIRDMSKDEILEFCEGIGVHPAKLMPDKMGAEYSLPTNLLELLIDMSNSEGKFAPPDITQALSAIAFENGRIHKFRSGQMPKEKMQNGGDGKKLTLTEIFETVLDNDVLMRRLAKETEECKRVMTYEPEADYPLATRVRNIAYTHVRDLEEVARRSTDTHLQKCANKLAEVRDGYASVIYPYASKEDTKQFIADTKEALLDRYIDPRQATIQQIEDVISQSDLTWSHVHIVHQYIRSKFGGRRKFEDASAKYIHALATSVAEYVQAEDRLFKAKKNCRRMIDAIPTRDAIEELFKAKDFAEGTLFRQLMDNHVLIALDTHQNQSLPSASP